MSDFEISVFNDNTLLVKDLTIAQRHASGPKVVKQPLRLPSPYDKQITELEVDISSRYVVKLFCSNPSEWIPHLTLNILNYTKDYSGLRSFEKVEHGLSANLPIIYATTSRGGLQSDGTTHWRLVFSNGIKFEKGIDLVGINLPPAYDVMSLVTGDRTAYCYDNGIGLDTIFMVDGFELKASKFMLVAASPVFESMLEDGKWKESHDNKIQIDDFDHETFEMYVKIIHGHQIKLTSFTEAVQLMLISKKYQTNALTEQVEQYLELRVNKKTVLEALTVGHNLGLERIKNLAVDFLKSSKYESAKELLGLDELCRHADLCRLVFECLRP